MYFLSLKAFHQPLVSIQITIVNTLSWNQPMVYSNLMPLNLTSTAAFLLSGLN